MSELSREKKIKVEYVRGKTHPCLTPLSISIFAFFYVREEFLFLRKNLLFEIITLSSCGAMTYLAKVIYHLAVYTREKFSMRKKIKTKFANETTFRQCN